MKEYVAPEFLDDGFHCPHCRTWTQQDWFFMTAETHPQPYRGMGRIPNFFISICLKRSCGKISLWISEDEQTGNMIYPAESTAPLPIDHMPDDVVEIYEEARAIFNNSPRGAAALLRLSIEVLMPHLKEDGKHLNSSIGNLVEKGLPEIIQKALDSLRVIGNNAVHPGQIDVNDDKETALALFHILDTIIDRTIIQEQRISEVYEKLPQSAKDQINSRDKNSSDGEEL